MVDSTHTSRVCPSDTRKPRGARFITHGESCQEHLGYRRFSLTYRTWLAMRARCLSPSNTSYMNYGGRGIKICSRWLKDYRNFLLDVGERPRGFTFDRINVDGNYELGNVRWASASTQSKNKRTSLIIVYQGKYVHLIDACNASGIKYGSIRTISCREKISHQDVFDDYINGVRRPRHGKHI